MKTLTLTILQFNTFVKNILDAEEFLSSVSVVGEVTNYKVSGGNAYFDLKEENAMLSCVQFGAANSGIKNGDLLTVTGRVNFYVKSGRLNFIVNKVQAYGMGDLYQRFLMLKEKLEQQGLFREEIKKPIPKFAKRVGVVTSETGAVIRDIIHVTKSKNPYTDIILYPSKVQGNGAEDELVAGIEYFNTRADIDVIIVGRGGGSLEDLAPFNTEKIVRAIYASDKPIISAVGHETDYSLCDFAADLRVPTPSVAAEVAVFDYYKVLRDISKIAENNYYNITKLMKNKKQNLKLMSDVLSADLKVKTSEAKASVNILAKEITNCIFAKKTSLEGKLGSIMGIISKLNPLEVLSRGYSIVNLNNKKVAGIEDIKIGDTINVEMHDGRIVAKVENKECVRR